jgi:hypothetical protein
MRRLPVLLGDQHCVIPRCTVAPNLPLFHMASILPPTPRHTTAQHLSAIEPRARLWLQGAALYVLGYAALLLFDAPIILLHVALIPPCLLAAWFAGEAAKRTADQRTSIAWHLVALALLIQALSDGAWTYFDVVGRTTMWDRLSHAPQVLITPLWLAAVLTFPRGSRTRADSIQFTLDSLTVVSAAAMVIWHFVLSPLLASDPANDTLLIYTTYAALDLITLVTAASMLLHDPGSTLRRSSWWIATGLMVGTIANAMWSGLQLRYAPAVAQTTDVMRIAGYLMIGVGTCVGWSDARGAARPARGVHLRARFSAVPYLAVALGYGLLFLVAIRESYRISEMVAGAIAMTALVQTNSISMMAMSGTIARVPNRSHPRFSGSDRSGKTIWPWISRYER